MAVQPRRKPQKVGKTVSKMNIPPTAEVPYKPPPRIKTQFCRYHLQGVCRYTEEDCAFAHTMEAMRDVKQTKKSIVNDSGKEMKNSLINGNGKNNGVNGHHKFLNGKVDQSEPQTNGMIGDAYGFIASDLDLAISMMAHAQVNRAARVSDANDLVAHQLMYGDHGYFPPPPFPRDYSSFAVGVDDLPHRLHPVLGHDLGGRATHFPRAHEMPVSTALAGLHPEKITVLAAQYPQQPPHTALAGNRASQPMPINDSKQQANWQPSSTMHSEKLTAVPPSKATPREVQELGQCVRPPPGLEQ